MNVFVNVMQGPCRAIISDIVPDDKQQTGNAMVSNVMGKQTNKQTNKQTIPSPISTDTVYLCSLLYSTSY